MQNEAEFRPRKNTWKQINNEAITKKVPPLFICCVKEHEGDNGTHEKIARWLIEKKKVSLIYKQKIKTPQFGLGKHKANMYVRAKDTALHWLAKNTNKGVKKIPEYIFEVMRERNLNQLVNYQDFDGNTPLHISVIWQNYSFAQLLLKNGAIVNKSNHFKNTPLHLCKSDSPENMFKMIRWLFDYGADITLLNGMDLTPLAYINTSPLIVIRSLDEKITQFFEHITLYRAIKKYHKQKTTLFSILPKELIILLKEYLMDERFLNKSEAGTQ